MAEPPTGLVLVSANAEWRAVMEIMAPKKASLTPYGETFENQGVRYMHGGWGKIAAAASTQYAIDHFQPGLLVNLGTCGGISGRIERGTVLLVTRTLVYDIIEQMSDPAGAIQHYSSEPDLGWLREPLPHTVTAALLVSADRDILADDIQMLVDRYGAVAADWESGAIAWVAKRNKVRCLILRGVTDLVSAQGGEAYGNYELFDDNTRIVMRKLLGQLPDWLAAAGI